MAARTLGVGPESTRLVGGVLLIVASAGFVLAGLAFAGWLLPHAWWPALGTLAVSASLLLFVAFPHPWLVVGLAISLGTLYAVWVGWPAGFPGT
jgi:hypothetical protein